MTRPRGELTTYHVRGRHATDWANPTRSPASDWLPPYQYRVERSLVCVEGLGRISQLGLTQDIIMGSCVFQCCVPHQWIAQWQVGLVFVYCDGVSCRVSAAWHSCVAAHLSKYKQAPPRYDLRCLKVTLNPKQTNKQTKSLCSFLHSIGKAVGCIKQIQEQDAVDPDSDRRSQQVGLHTHSHSSRSQWMSKQALKNIVFFKHLGAVHNYQHFHKCTKGTLFLKVYNNKKCVLNISKNSSFLVIYSWNQ